MGSNSHLNVRNAKEIHFISKKHVDGNWLEKPQNVSVTAKRGSTVSFKCARRPSRIDGRPMQFTWLYNSVPIMSDAKFSIINSSDGLSSKLIVHDPDTIDSGYYRCDANDRGVVFSSTGILRVFPGESTLDFNSFESDGLEDVGRDVYFLDDTGTTPFCEPYRGSLCANLIGRRMIYVISEGQQDATEQKLAASKVMNSFLETDSRMTEECAQSILFLACVYAFPPCNNQLLTTGTMKKQDPDYNPRPRQLCRSDCNYVYDITCKSLLKDPSANPFINDKLPTCAELPPASGHSDCVSLSYLLNAEPNGDHLCYNKTGKHYRGLVAHSASGKPCLPWTSVTSRKEYKHLSYISHPELGNHQYCRNPGEDLVHQTPWCFVRSNHGSSNVVEEACNVPKCGGLMDSELWMVIIPSVMIPVGLALILIFTYLICCKRKRPQRSKRRQYSSTSSDKNGHYYQTNSMGSFLPSKKRRFFQRSTSSGQPITSANGSFDARNMRQTGSLLSAPSTINGKLLGNGGSFPAVVGSQSNDAMSNRRSTGRESSQTLDSKHSGCRDIISSQVHYVKEVGEGRFGLCYICELNEPSPRNSRVAKRQYFVRTLKHVDLLDQFLGECHALTSKPPRHANIACLIGLCQEPPAAFFEYLPFDLHEVLLRQRSTVADSALNIRLSPCLERVAAALAYLAGRKLVHRDVAARNVLIDNDWQPNQVKLCDFASCRPSYAGDYYRLGGSMLPVRWMAPESVITGAYTTQSDIWSFGVLIWEFCSSGGRPHDGATNPEVFERLRDRQLLPLPSVPPTMAGHKSITILNSIMMECWADNPNHRPLAGDLMVRLKTVIDNSMFEQMREPRNQNAAFPLESYQFKV